MHHLFEELSQKFSFVLASSSPRRQQLLTELGLDFVVQKKDTPENIRDFFYKKDIVHATYEKLNAIPCQKNKIIIACDTIVVYNSRVFGKPCDKEEANRFLHLLSGKKHYVYSCVAVKVNGSKGIRYYHGVEKTAVSFRKLSEKEIADYINTKEPYDKAGAYGVQGTARLFINKVNGCYYNVMGLPLNKMLKLLYKVKKEYLDGPV